MSLANSNGDNMVMPVTPMGYGAGYGGYGGGFGNCFGGDASWLILFIILALGGGWGNGFGGGFDGGAFPWLMTGQAGINANTNAGFDNAAIASQLSGIQTSLTTGFSNAEVAGCNRAMDSMQTAYNNQIASMNQNFANQQALDNRLYAMQTAQQDCCCENRLATANLTATILSENCADRAAVSDGIRDILTAQTAGTQRILDKLCDQELAAERRENDQLRQQLNMANLAASQTAQTAQLMSDNTAQTQALINRIAPYPTPSYIVGNPYYTPFGYGYNTGCGCNGGTF